MLIAGGPARRLLRIGCRGVPLGKGDPSKASAASSACHVAASRSRSPGTVRYSGIRSSTTSESKNPIFCWAAAAGARAATRRAAARAERVMGPPG